MILQNMIIPTDETLTTSRGGRHEEVRQLDGEVMGVMEQSETVLVHDEG